MAPPAPVPELPVVEKLLQRLMAETQIRQPAPVMASEPAGLETLLRLLLSGQLALVQQPRQGSSWRDWNAVVCFSCGKAGHSVTHCPTLYETFPFMLPGWKAEKTQGGNRIKHDVTIVDMGDLPESPVSMDELSLLRRQRSPTVHRHMVWMRWWPLAVAGGS